MPSLIGESLAEPGTHALVIGVSHYPHLPGGEDPSHEGESFLLDQLSTAARSASEFVAWLLNEYHNPKAPLKSLRVLLSPAPGELLNAHVQARLPADYAATRSAVEEDLVGFRAACDSHRENVAIVYVAGHGVQMTKHGSVLLLEDFAKPGQLSRLQGAIDMAGVHAGMNHPATAQTQFWFVDACRQKPEIARRFETLTGALNLDVPNGDAVASPLFLAATTGSLAFGRLGGVSLFNEALMWALRQAGAAEGPGCGDEYWRVTVTQLIKVLPERVKALAAAHGEIQSVDVAGKVRDATLHTYRDTPKVDLQVNLNPEEARSMSIANLIRGDGQVQLANQKQWPFVTKVAAGLYMLSISTKVPYRDTCKILNIKPPQYQDAVICPKG
jgi:hypothetical protein